MGRLPVRRDLVVLVLLVLGVMMAWEGHRAWQEGRQAQAIAAAARPGDIRMISSETCLFCTRARQWFTLRQVPFSECFIERDAACAADFRALRGPGTPLLIVRGEVQIGFSPERVARALARPAHAAPAHSPSSAGSPRP